MNRMRVHAFLCVGILQLSLACGGRPAPGTDVALPDSLPVSQETRAHARADSATAPQIAEPSPPDLQALAAAVESMRGDLTRLTAAVTAIRVPENTSGPLASATDSVAQEQAEVLSGERVREAAQDAQNFGLRAFWSIIVLVLAWLFIRTVVWLLDTMAERTAARRLFFKKLIPVVRLVIWTAVAYYIITSVFNVDRTGLLAATAALGVGIGFAAQGILRNLFGGLIIIFDQPFQVGDKIRVGGTYGEVVSIGMRATRIVTPDDNLVSVPNAQVVEDQVANANAGALDCQVVVDLYLPGWVDATKAKAIAYAAAASSRYVYLEKPIVVNVKDEFKETFLTHLVVKAYVVDARYEFALASDVTETAKAEFLKEGMLQPLIDVRQLTTAAAAQTGEQEPVEFS